MARNYHPIEGDIPSISNEVELSLLKVTAQDVIRNAPHLEIDPEVNQVDIVELLVSMAPDIAILNRYLEQYTKELLCTVEQLGGAVYGGSSLLRNVEDREPAWYRTTSLSKTLARNLLDITSQQIVIGVDNERFGIHLYNMLRQLTPIVLAMSASSPYKDVNGQLINTGTQSRRISQYKVGMSRFPSSMIETPEFHSLNHYFDVLQQISNQINGQLENGELDSNFEELYRSRENGNYAPFNTLSSHQVYGMVRLRPDHQNTESAFSIELRPSDTPVSVDRMQTINSFVTGLSYYCARFGFEEIQQELAILRIHGTQNSVMPTLERVARDGLSARFGLRRKPMSKILQRLIPFAVKGLTDRGFDSEEMCSDLSRLLECGNDAQSILRVVRENQIVDPPTLENLLAQELRASIH